MRYKSRFQNRYDAGKKLAQGLAKFKRQPNTVVLGLPRGGVPVAYEVAKSLSLPLDIFVVRKLGVPFQPELAMGAIASGGRYYLNDKLIANLDVSQQTIARVRQQEEAELLRREKTYRAGRTPIDLTDKTVILVDDGLATGASMKAAISALHTQPLAKLVVAVPVAPTSAINRLTNQVDELICLIADDQFQSVGQYYDDFSQTDDSEVEQLLGG